MCTESLDKVKFVTATVKPNDSESAVLESIENQIILRKKRDPIVQTTIEELKEICTALKYNPELDMDINDYSADWTRTIEDAISHLQKKG